MASCLNAYIGVNRFDIMVEIIPQLLAQIPDQRERLLRDLATAYREMGDNDEQINTLKMLLKAYPMSDANHYRVFRCLHKLDMDLQAFYHLELALAQDPDDIDYLLSISGFVLDECLYRISDGEIKKSLRKEECVKAALPFLMQAMKGETSSRCLQKCKDFILRNGVAKYEKIFDQWIEEGIAELWLVL